MAPSSGRLTLATLGSSESPTPSQVNDGSIATGSGRPAKAPGARDGVRGCARILPEIGRFWGTGRAARADPLEGRRTAGALPISSLSPTSTRPDAVVVTARGRGAETGATLRLGGHMQ